jgi:hypothetical protein
VTSRPSPSSSASARRRQSLALRAGEREVVLLPDDVNTLIDGIDRLVDAVNARIDRSHRPHEPHVSRDVLERVEALRGVLGASTSKLTDPAVEITREDARLLRQVMADISGYQRSDLTRGLIDLSLALDGAFPF